MTPKKPCAEICKSCRAWQLWEGKESCLADVEDVGDCDLIEDGVYVGPDPDYEVDDEGSFDPEEDVDEYLDDYDNDEFIP